MTTYISKDEINRRLAGKGKPHIKAKSGSYGFKDRITFLCEKHNYEWQNQLSSTLYKKYCCPQCGIEGRTQQLKNRYNLWDEAPEVARLLKNPNDAYGLAKFSKEKKYFVCPTCGEEYYRSVAMISSYGFSCKMCSDNISYPNKFMRCLLNQLGINYADEFSPEWISPYRYDFMFVVKKKKVIVEMDGYLGHGQKSFSNKENPLFSLSRDVFKNEEAKRHKYIVVRIDCRKSEFEYIKNNVLQSLLCELLPLDNVNWLDLQAQTNRSLLVEICEYYAKYPYYSYNDMIEKFHIKEDTLRKYLSIGYKLGLCPKYTNSFGKYLLCLESQIVFSSCAACGKYYGIDEKSVSRVCNKERNTAGGLHFMWLKEYDGDIDALIPNYDIKATNYKDQFAINVYDETGQFIEQLSGKGSVKKKYKISAKKIKTELLGTHNSYNGFLFYYATDSNQPDGTKIIS